MEEMSDSEFIEGDCDEQDEDHTWYPSESVVEEWKQVKEKKNEYKESLKQGHCQFTISYSAKFYDNELTCLFSFDLEVSTVDQQAIVYQMFWMLAGAWLPMLYAQLIAIARLL